MFPLFVALQGLTPHPCPCCPPRPSWDNPHTCQHPWAPPIMPVAVTSLVLFVISRKCFPVFPDSLRSRVMTLPLA